MLIWNMNYFVKKLDKKIIRGVIYKLEININIVELTDECFGGYGMGDQYMYICPSCDYENIIEEFKFCPNCGKKIKWSLKGRIPEDC